MRRTGPAESADEEVQWEGLMAMADFLYQYLRLRSDFDATLLELLVIDLEYNAGQNNTWDAALWEDYKRSVAYVREHGRPRGIPSL